MRNLITHIGVFNNFSFALRSFFVRFVGKVGYETFFVRLWKRAKLDLRSTKWVILKALTLRKSPTSVATTYNRKKIVVNSLLVVPYYCGCYKVPFKYPLQWFFAQTTEKAFIPHRYFNRSRYMPIWNIDEIYKKRLETTVTLKSSRD